MNTFLLSLGLVVIVLLPAIFGLLLVAWIGRYSLDEHHLRYKVFGLISIRSLPYAEIKNVGVVPWWREWNWRECLSTEIWMGNEFRRTRVLITTSRSRRPFLLLSPSDSAAFATTLLATISKQG
jgi:hypothetical protein